LSTTALIVILVVVAASVLIAGPIVVLLRQRATQVTHPTGKKYWVQVSPTGFVWVSWFNVDTSWIGADLRWVRRLLQRKKTWTITIKEEKPWRSQPTLWSEECPTGKVAIRRFWEVRDSVRDGLLPSS
jgi:hypothetical protein